VRLKVSPLADLETTREGPDEMAPATVQSEPPETLTLDLETTVDDPPPPTVTLVEFCAVLV
jgi:hypothetical protein